MRVLAMGDPQAPFAKVMEVLRHHRALGSNGQLAADVHLVSMGDHFDWGTPGDRARATHDALELLSWLAGHSAEQCTLILGNHDLARVQELADFTDETYAAGRELADELYRHQRGDSDAFAANYPTIASAEVLARDLSTFSVAQRTLVTTLLRSGRFQLAFEHAGVLCVHAGVTAKQFAALGERPTTAAQAANLLNTWLAERVSAWHSGPLLLEPFVVAAGALRGEATGALHHRPCEPSMASSAPGRRYDPRDLPEHFPQVIGHIRDPKCRELMPSWTQSPHAGDGPLRSLTIADGAGRYTTGVDARARLIFCDGGLSHADATRYELLDLTTRRPADR